MPDGTVKHLDVAARAMNKEGGVELVGAIRDVTAQVQAEEALRRTHAALAHVTRVVTLGEMSASIAHEVNQPLAAVLINAEACLQWLGADSPNIEEARAAARRIVRDGTRAGDVIARLRALFQKNGTQKQAFDVNEAIEEAIALTRGEIRKHRAILGTELAQNLPRAMGNRVQFQQVVINLILNGAQAMSNVHDRPRDLIVGSEPVAGGVVRMTVRDAGVGLDPSLKDRIFDAFTTSKSEGMGMGLSICRAIVQDHGGQIWAADNEDGGTTFSFTIPGTSENGPIHTNV
jgi:C4-dicarboxylate-specific signal transduction histidine kinase